MSSGISEGEGFSRIWAEVSVWMCCMFFLPVFPSPATETLGVQEGFSLMSAAIGAGVYFAVRALADPLFFVAAVTTTVRLFSWFFSAATGLSGHRIHGFSLAVVKTVSCRRDGILRRRRNFLSPLLKALHPGHRFYPAPVPLSAAASTPTAP